MTRLQRIATRVILLMILPILFIGMSDDAFAKKKKKKRVKSKHKIVRSYNPKQTKKQALDVLRNGSDELSALAGLSPEEDVANNIKLATNFIEREYSNLYTTDRDLKDAEFEGEDLSELEQEDDVIVDVDNFKVMWMSFMYDDDPAAQGTTMCGLAKQEIMDNIMDWIGTPYLFGGNTRRAIDCSAFVREIYHSTGNIMLPRTAREQNTVGIKVARKNLEFGDLVFFNTRRGVYVSHVGIYLGDNLFAHASSRYGVTVSSLESEYYNKRLIGAKRLTEKDLLRLSLDNRDKRFEQ